jgi:hypothetical protein
VFEPSDLGQIWADDHFAKPCDCGPVSAYRSANDRHVMVVFCGEVMTVIPS